MLQTNTAPAFKHTTLNTASPILKWAGGKTQLLPIFDTHYPSALKNGAIKTYIEPFLGGAAVFFDIVNRFDIENAFLFDINPEIICLYNSIKESVNNVIEHTGNIENTYLSLGDEDRKEYYYQARINYNLTAKEQYTLIPKNPVNAQRAAQTIFLNRTCFNGLYRVNSKGHFNVPIGSYKNPTILFEDKLNAAASAFSIADIRLTDFESTEDIAKDNKTFVYYDPPYRPISQTSQFTSYAADDFNDTDQIRLAKMYSKLDKSGSYQMLSNSDPCNFMEDPFFDTLYEGFSINRIRASRRINADSSKRGYINELLITNYKTE